MDHPVHDPPPPLSSAVDGERLREAMRRVPSPVAVITAAAGGRQRGATIGSLTSVSLDPPLVSFNVTHGTSFHRLLEEAGDVRIHVLTDEQAGLAEHFARTDTVEQFEGIALEDLPPGEPPCIKGCRTVLRAAIWQRYPAGDNDIVVCRVDEVWLSPSSDGPLVYLERAYRPVGERV